MIDIQEFFTPFDERIDKFFLPLRDIPAANQILFAASNVADHSLIWFTLAAARGVRKGGASYATRAAFALLAESVLVNMGIKTIFRRKRPEWEGERPHEIRQPLTSSFPSGHASAAFTSLIILGDNDRLWPIYLGLALLIAPSRIHVRMHHASDVLAGAMVGIGYGMLIKKVFPISKSIKID
ncbi:phosphatase PAP2 family protein [Acidithrix ferrooxidans]|uniref:PAP2 superfamily protein n=1 Tax=Acidithrix ferrooxidans TaxID=1280514 RepID=A0A0D8HK52_9ACTN|nr:phosphatase PAP2 family protein [Acidithrix ferrooxidans]KJF18318.1 PAP2 superfamily protein [Acidithrix ferrooxidans]